jgi:hypothetical protein
MNYKEWNGVLLLGTPAAGIVWKLLHYGEHERSLVPWVGGVVAGGMLYILFNVLKGNHQLRLWTQANETDSSDVLMSLEMDEKTRDS